MRIAAQGAKQAAKQRSTTAQSRAAFTSSGRQSTAAMEGRADAEQQAAARIETGSRGRPKRDAGRAQRMRPGKCTGRRPKAPEKAPEGPKKRSTAGSRKRRSADGSRAGPRQPVRVARVAIALPFAEQPNNSTNGAGRRSGQDASERVLNEFAARAVPGGRWVLLDKYRPAYSVSPSEQTKSERIKALKWGAPSHPTADGRPHEGRENNHNIENYGRSTRSRLEKTYWNRGRPV